MVALSKLFREVAMAGARRLALVIGATGAVGSEVSRALSARGWQVRALARSLSAARQREPGLDWVGGDAMDHSAMVAAAADAAVIFHAANPPLYRNWRGLALPMLANAVAAAEASGARLIFPGNLYNFGPDAWPVVAETAPQHPTTRKGAVRLEMEAMLHEAGRRGLRSLVVRAGDFFGPSAANSWLAKVIMPAGKSATRIVYPGPLEVGHAWAYLPDLAETIARLAEIEADLPTTTALHFGGHWVTGVELVEAVRHVTGDPRLPARQFPWSLVGMAAPFVPFLSELWEMRYLWRQPVKLDNAKLVATLGDEPKTPLITAMKRTLGAFGCLPEDQP
jgi:nucleoside-diphosphate-sugar epimerase